MPLIASTVVVESDAASGLQSNKTASVDSVPLTPSERARESEHTTVYSTEAPDSPVVHAKKQEPRITVSESSKSESTENSDKTVSTSSESESNQGHEAAVTSEPAAPVQSVEKTVPARPQRKTRKRT